MSSAARLLFAGVVGLALAAGVVLVLSRRPSASEAARARALQELVGGLGFGPALDLSRCAFSVDPRLCPACSQEVGLVPGGKALCPHHAAAVIDYPSSGGAE